MAKDNKLRWKPGTKCSRAPQYLLQSKLRKRVHPKIKPNKGPEKKTWEEANCSVCMEFPHNAVLLLCSSYDKGCRPYMCATSHRYSNCLEQYKKAYTKVASAESSALWSGSVSVLGSVAGNPSERTEVSELMCPLCRGQVKGWTVVEPARKYLNSKKRSCMQDKCKFIGSYKELRKHVKAKHPLARPREVDPVLEEKWKTLERERERSDVISTIISSTPGAVVLGDYVLEPNQDDFYSDSDLDSEDDDLEFGFGSVNLGRNSSIFSRFHMASDPGNGDGFRDHRSTLSSFLEASHRRNLHRLMLTRRRWRSGGTQRDN